MYMLSKRLFFQQKALICYRLSGYLVEISRSFTNDDESLVLNWILQWGEKNLMNKEVGIPLIVSKLVSKKPACIERNWRSLYTTSTSVNTTPLKISSSSQDQNCVRAAASLKRRHHIISIPFSFLFFSFLFFSSLFFFSSLVC